MLNNANETGPCVVIIVVETPIDRKSQNLIIKSSSFSLLLYYMIFFLRICTFVQNIQYINRVYLFFPYFLASVSVQADSIIYLINVFVSFISFTNRIYYFNVMLLYEVPFVYFFYLFIGFLWSFYFWFYLKLTFPGKK